MRHAAARAAIWVTTFWIYSDDPLVYFGPFCLFSGPIWVESLFKEKDVMHIHKVLQRPLGKTDSDRQDKPITDSMIATTSALPLVSALIEHLVKSVWPTLQTVPLVHAELAQISASNNEKLLYIYDDPKAHITLWTLSV